jgi:hypothetical protein
MKLEIKYVSAYLPYGLKVLHTEWSGKCESNIVNIQCISDEYITFSGNASDWYFDNNENECEIKPILRSFLDLTKEIDCPEVMGEKILHVRELIKIADGYVADDDNLNQWWYNYINDISKYPRYVHELINTYLLKHHFDIYNLIPNNLAIDINTLK